MILHCRGKILEGLGKNRDINEKKYSKSKAEIQRLYTTLWKTGEEGRKEKMKEETKRHQEKPERLETIFTYIKY